MTTNIQKTYLDYNASAPLRPEALDVMVDVLKKPGNASSIHSFGREARSAVETAREQVANLLSTRASDIIFTSGATEANNMVLSSFKTSTIWASAIEHPSILSSPLITEVIPVNEHGVIDLDAYSNMLENCSAPDLITTMLVNNETGTIQPVETMARLAKKKHPDVHFHTDGVQAAGRIEINFQALQVDFLSLSAHKIGGPQGIGALVFLPGAHIKPLMTGGGQERRLRPGTENVAGIAGFGKACELVGNEIASFQDLVNLRDYMEEQLIAIAPEIVIFGRGADRVSNTCAMSLPSVPAQTQLMALDLDGIAVSSGAACSSGKVDDSPVAQAMNIPKDVLRGAFRISMGHGTTQEHIDHFLQSWKKMYLRRSKKSSMASQ
jgi:cysteine desulfurase